MKVTQLCLTLSDLMDSTVHGILQARILEWVAFPLLQGIFSTQVSNIGLLHGRWILYPLSHKGSPRIMEWVAYPFSSRSSRPRDQTRVSCIAGGFFTNWTIREAILDVKNLLKMLVEGFCRCFVLTHYSTPSVSPFSESCIMNVYCIMSDLCNDSYYLKKFLL